MNGKQYMETQFRIIEIGKNAATLDINGFIQAIENAEKMAPMLDAQLLIKASDNLNAMKGLALAIKEVKAAHEKVFKTVIKTAVTLGKEMPGEV